MFRRPRDRRWSCRPPIIALSLALCIAPAAAQEGAPEEGGEARQRILRGELERAQMKSELERMRKEMEELSKRIEAAEEAPRPSAAEPSESDWTVSWKSKLILENKAEGIKLTFGGRIHAEAGFFDEDSGIRNEPGVGPLDDGGEIRRARIDISGQYGKHLGFKTQYEYAEGEVGLRSIYLDFRNLPGIGTIRVGQQKEPFSLVQQASTNNTPFIDRATTTTFQPLRNLGIAIRNHYEERIHWSAEVFRVTDDAADSRGQGSGEYNVTARLTGAPLYRDDGELVLHLGVAYSHRDPTERMLRYRSAPPNGRFAPRFVDTGLFTADAIDLFGTEAAVVLGSLSVQGEYVHSFVDRPGGERERFKAYYAEAMLFVTGEHRNYRGDGGVFGTVDIPEPFDIDKGQWGAVELGLRYTFIDLNSGPIRGRQMADVTAAVNWYVFRSNRIMFDYTRSKLYGVGEADLFVMRFQAVF